METNSERRRRKLAELCAERGVAAVAESAGLHWQSLDQVIKGTLLPPKKDGTRRPKNLGNDAAQKIEVAQSLGAGWFDSDIPSATTNDVGNVVDISDHQRLKSKPIELVIPEFNTGGSMGKGLLLRDQPGVIRGWSVNQEWVNKNVKSHSGAANLCIVTGFGDSMKGMFNPGDPLLVDRGVKAVEFDAVYFFRVDGEGFIKRLQRIPGEGLRVLSENQKYESWTIKEGMDFEVLGRVLKAWQGEDF